MASACLNRVNISPLECSQKYSSYNWFTHRLSISREEDASKTKRISSTVKNCSDLADVTDQAKEVSDLIEQQDPTDFDGFEFRLDGSVMMLPADELFSDGKLVPLQLSVLQHEHAISSTTVFDGKNTDLRPDTPFSRRRSADDAVDPYLFSPRAPRCSSRWKELLGFRKPNQTSNDKVDTKDNNKRTSIRQLLRRKSSYDSSVNLPLLKEIDYDLASVSSRPSLSSSSSSHDLDDLPRLSLDSDNKKLHQNLNLNCNSRSKTRLVKPRHSLTDTRATSRVGRTAVSCSQETKTTNRGLSVDIDSPRMNASGKIVFHSLERSSSSPSSFNNGGHRFNHRGMERSYSANVRVTPVLNVPVCSKSGSMFGFPIFSSQQKQQGCSTSSSSSSGCGSNRSQRFNNSSNR